MTTDDGLRALTESMRGMTTRVEAPGRPQEALTVEGVLRAIKSVEPSPYMATAFHCDEPTALVLRHLIPRALSTANAFGIPVIRDDGLRFGLIEAHEYGGGTRTIDILPPCWRGAGQ